MLNIEIKEYIKCRDTPTYFIEKYVKYINNDGDLISLNLDNNEKNIISDFHNNLGVSLELENKQTRDKIIVSYMLWCIVFTQDYNIGIFSNTRKESEHILAQLIRCYKNLPKWLQPRVIHKDKKKFILENYVHIFTATYRNCCHVRAVYFNFLLLDGYAHTKNKIVAEEFIMGKFSILESKISTKVFLSSAPNSINQHYDWLKNRKGMIFHATAL